MLNLMKEKSRYMKITIIIFLVAISTLYLTFSSSGKIIIDDRGTISGYTNVARELIQGKRFWKDQLRLVQKEIAWELGEPARQAQFEREMRQMDAEINREMKEFYQNNPDMRPTRAERQAEALRERADAIEYAQLLRELENTRRERIAELQNIKRYLEAKLK